MIQAIKRGKLGRQVHAWCKDVLIEAGRHYYWTPRLVVLCYHSIHPARTSRSASPELFDQHLTWLETQCEIVQLKELSEYSEARESKRPLVALTFDDGYLDNYQYVFPRLAAHSIRATFFVTVGLPEHDRNTLEAFMRQPGVGPEVLCPLEWPQIVEMHRNGMSFGAHTFSHPNLARLSRKEVEMELRLSKEILEQHLGKRVTQMAYPFGRPTAHFNKETINIAAEVGYELSTTLVSKPVHPNGPRLEMPRFLIDNDDINILSDKVLGAWDMFGRLQEAGFTLGVLP